MSANPKESLISHCLVDWRQWGREERVWHYGIKATDFPDWIDYLASLNQQPDPAIDIKLRTKAGLNDSVIVHGEISTKTSGACQKCLKPMRREQNMNFSWLLSEKPLKDGEMQEFDIIVTGGNQLIDLHELVREELIMEVAPVLSHNGDCAEQLVDSVSGTYQAFASLKHIIK